jgi:hypothetical protein
MNVSTYPNIQVTQTQLDDFCVWATEKYGNYRVYNDAIQSEELDNYIRRHILSHEMNNILQETDMYVGIRSNEPHITSLQIHRQSILIKASFIKIKLGRRIFAAEVAEIRAQREEIYRQQAIIRRSRHNLENDEMTDDEMTDDSSIPITRSTIRKIVQKQLTSDEVEKSMVEDCVICFSKHKMTATCVIPCGHQFGSKCFTSWKNNTCPLCRTPCLVVTEFTAPKRRRYFTDDETDALRLVSEQSRQVVA